MEELFTALAQNAVRHARSGSTDETAPGPDGLAVAIVHALGFLRARLEGEVGMGAAIEVDDAIRSVLDDAAGAGRPVIRLGESAETHLTPATMRAMRILEDAVDTAITLSEQFGARNLPVALAGEFLDELGMLRGGVPEADALIHQIAQPEMMLQHRPMPDPETGALN